MDRYNDDTARTLRYYINVAAVRRREIAIVVIASVLLALGFTWQQNGGDSTSSSTASASSARRSTATVRLVIGSPSDLLTASVDPVTVATQAQMIDSAQVAQRVITNLSLQISVHEVLRRLTVRPIVGTEAIAISYEDRDPGAAAEIALEFANEYLAMRGHALDKEIAERQKDLQQTISLYRAAKAPSAQALLLSQVVDVRQQLSDLLQLGRGGAHVLATSTKTPPATEETSGGSSDTGKYVRNGAAGLILGLVLGLALAFLVDALDDRFRDRIDVERTLNTVVLQELPAPDASSTDALRLLRHRVTAISAERSSQQLVVTAATGADGTKALVDALSGTATDEDRGSDVTFVDGGSLPSSTRVMTRGTPALLVIRPASTSRAQAEDAVRTLRDLGVDLIGCVITPVDEPRSPYQPIYKR